MSPFVTELGSRHPGTAGEPDRSSRFPVKNRFLLYYRKRVKDKGDEVILTKGQRCCLYSQFFKKRPARRCLPRVFLLSRRGGRAEEWRTDLESSDFTILEMLGCIYEDLDIDKIEEKFVDLVGQVFSFDRIALFFVKHKKEVLQGKLSRGFDPEVIRKMEIPIGKNSVLMAPLVSGIPLRNPLRDGDPYVEALQLTNFALIPIVSKKRVSCWELKNCGTTDCPAYGKKWIRCWLVSGTKCGRGPEYGVEDKAELCAACPIFSDHNVQSAEGVMLIDNSQSNKPVTDDLVTLLAIIAHSVGLAINNSKLYRRTLEVAIRDSMTGLHNRRYFDERLLDEVDRARRYDEKLSLIICDIDHFKKVNDTYGHPVGDAVLCWVAEILGNALRKTDVVSRYGGEEFAAVLVNTGKDQAMQIAEKLRSIFGERMFRDGATEIRVTLSFGVSSLMVDSIGFEGLLSRADKALYRAKAQGRNRVCAA